MPGRFQFPRVCKGVTVIIHSTESISDDVSKVKSLISKGLPESTCSLPASVITVKPVALPHLQVPRDELVCERHRSVDTTLGLLHL